MKLVEFKNQLKLYDFNEEQYRKQLKILANDDYYLFDDDRQSGTTTMLFELALYYLEQNKSVVFLSNNITALDVFYYNNVMQNKEKLKENDFKIIDKKIIKNSRSLSFKTNNRFNIDDCRGYRDLIVIVDEISLSDIDKFKML